MSSFKQIQILKQPKSGQIYTDDTLYWKNFEFPTTLNEYGGISHIDVARVAPHLVAATHASRVQIYDCQKDATVKQFSFSENVYSASFRDDARLMCIGFESNNAKVFPILTDENSGVADDDVGDEEKTGTAGAKPKKHPLRKFDDHLGPVHVCKFMRNMFRVMTGSDDMHVRIFDLGTGSTLMKLKAHKDYIRTGVTSRSSDDLLLTGSYDHTVKLIDARTHSVVLGVDHGEPVESVLLFPSANMFVSCGGTSIKVWDVLKGGNLMHTLNKHHKTVTNLAFSHNYKYLLSSGLDRHLQVYDLLNYDLVHTIDYPSSILSFGLLPEDKGLIVGMADGLLSIKHRKKDTSSITTNATEGGIQSRMTKKPAANTYNPYKYISPSLISNSGATDHVITHGTKQHLKKYDKHLKKFDATKALNAALEIHVRMNNPQTTVSVFQELIRRGNLNAALAGKDEKALGIVVKFIQRNIGNPNFTATLVDVSNFLLDLYMNEIGKYAAMDDLFVRLKTTIDSEIAYQTNLLQITGTLETIFLVQNQVSK